MNNVEKVGKMLTTVLGNKLVRPEGNGLKTEDGMDLTELVCYMEFLDGPMVSITIAEHGPRGKSVELV